MRCDIPKLHCDSQTIETHHSFRPYVCDQRSKDTQGLQDVCSVREVFARFTVKRAGLISATIWEADEAVCTQLKSSLIGKPVKNGYPLNCLWELSSPKQTYYIIMRSFSWLSSLTIMLWLSFLTSNVILRIVRRSKKVDWFFNWVVQKCRQARIV